MSIDRSDSELMRELVADATADGIKRALSDPEAWHAASADGIKRVLSDPETWHAASSGLKKHATAEAGGWLLGGVRLVFSRLMWLCVAGLAIYLIGGWSALVAFFKSGSVQS